LPFIKEVAVFYEEFFKLDRFGFYEANPSYSPMSAKGDKTKGIYINKDATIDFAIARELLTNMIQGASSANMYLDEIDKWKDMLTKIPSPAIQDDGSLRDYAADTSDYTTAGVAALYSALVSKEVDFLTDDEAIKPYLISARKKLAESYNYQTSLTLINLARVFIRLQQRQQAVECLTNAINYCGLNNLALSFCDWRNNGVVGFDVWSPLQLSTNMAFTAAIQEMLLYSKEGVIKILPCIPDGWKNIEVEGLKAVDALTVKISLNEKNILNVDIKARKNANFDLYLPDNVKRLKKSGEYALTINENVYIKGIKLSAGKTVSFSFVCA
jgi:alpha-L-fucosidase 2